VTIILDADLLRIRIALHDRVSQLRADGAGTLASLYERTFNMLGGLHGYDYQLVPGRYEAGEFIPVS
jgi:hypothetical protein